MPLLPSPSWKQRPQKLLLFGHLPSNQARQASHAGTCRRNKDRLLSYIFLWTTKHGHTSVGRSAKTYIYQLWTEIGCSQENLLRTMMDREGCCMCVCVCVWKREKEREREGNLSYRHTFVVMMINNKSFDMNFFLGWETFFLIWAAPFSVLILLSSNVWSRAEVSSTSIVPG